MAKDPAFLFYPGDFNTGTQFFTDEQVGKYMRLLMAQHQHGHLSENHVLIICKSYDKDVMNKFVKDPDGLWYNERLENEIVKRRNYSKSRSENRVGKNNISSTHDNHMENENRIISVESIKLNRAEIENEIFEDERFIADLNHAHPGKNIKKAWKECFMHHSQKPNPPQLSWQWRQKLNSWLSNEFVNSKISDNGKPKSKIH